MTDIILKAGCAILLVAVVFLAGVCWVNLRTIDDLSTRNEELSASLKAVDLVAKEQDQTYKENLNAIQKNSKRDRDAVVDYYERMLPKTPDSTGAGNPAQDTQGVDARCGQQTLSGCPVEVERRCVEDALTVGEVSEFFKVNKFPVID